MTWAGGDTLSKYRFHHECALPGRASRRRTPFLCPVCRRTWTPEGKGAWRTDDVGGEPVSVTMRYPDGTEQTFEVTSGRR